MDTLLRITGIGKLISFYRYIYFNGPEVVKWSGLGLILMIGLTHMYEFPEHFEAAKYIGLSFGALFTGTLLTAWGILLGQRWMPKDKFYDTLDEEESYSSIISMPGHKMLGMGRHWHFFTIIFWLLNGFVYVASTPSALAGWR
jgi:hypothetical protein